MQPRTETFHEIDQFSLRFNLGAILARLDSSILDMLDMNLYVSCTPDCFLDSQTTATSFSSDLPTDLLSHSEIAEFTSSGCSKATQ